MYIFYVYYIYDICKLKLNFMLLYYILITAY